MPGVGRPVRCSLMRGGTSRGVIVRSEDVSSDREELDEQILRMLGSPDPAQLDGLGGASAQTSKFAIIGPSTHPEADLDYTFAQVGLGKPVVDMTGTCGNLSAAAALFAAEEKLVPAGVSGGSPDGSEVTVRLHNTNTGDIIVAHVTDPVTAGRFDHGITRPVFLDYAALAGKDPSALFPTGHVSEQITSGGRTFTVSLCQVGNAMLYVRAEDLGISGEESPAELDSRADLIAVLDELRDEGRRRLVEAGLTTLASADTRLPLIGILARPSSPEMGTGSRVGDPDAVDIVLRIRAVDRTHLSIAGSAAASVAAASTRPGSVPAGVTRRSVEHGEFVIAHPAGLMRVQVEAAADGTFERLAFERTARRIMEGIVYV